MPLRKKISHNLLSLKALVSRSSPTDADEAYRKLPKNSSKSISLALLSDLSNLWTLTSQLIHTTHDGITTIYPQHRKVAEELLRKRHYWDTMAKTELGKFAREPNPQKEAEWFQRLVLLGMDVYQVYTILRSLDGQFYMHKINGDLSVGFVGFMPSVVQAIKFVEKVLPIRDEQKQEVGVAPECRDTLLGRKWEVTWAGLWQHFDDDLWECDFQKFYGGRREEG